VVPAGGGRPATVYTTCWRSPTLTSFAAPTSLHATQTISQETTVRITGPEISPSSGFGAISYDPMNGWLWACLIDSNNPQNGQGTVGTVPVPAVGETAVAFTPRWKVPTSDGGGSCNNHLAYDPTNESLWLGGDTASTLYDVDTRGALQSSVPLPSGAAESSGVTTTTGTLLWSVSNTSPKVVWEAPLASSSPPTLSRSPAVQVMSSNKRIDSLLCDDQTYGEPVLWVNFGKYDEFQVWTIPSSNGCGGPAPPPAALAISAGASPSPVVADSQLTYTAVVTAGSSEQDGVTVSPTTPADAILDSATWTNGAGGGSCSGAPLTCDVGALAPGGSATVTVVVTPILPESEQFTASAESVQTASVSSNPVPVVVTGDGQTSYDGISDTTSGSLSAPLVVGGIQTVQWDNLGPLDEHGAGDSTGLISTGLLSVLSYATTVFPAAGTYTVSDANTAYPGSRSVPVALTPTSGTLLGGIPVTWASSMPFGATENVQYSLPGSTNWKTWLTGQTGTGATFTNMTTTGTYRFRAVLTYDSVRIGYSPVLKVNVTS